MRTSTILTAGLGAVAVAGRPFTILLTPVVDDHCAAIGRHKSLELKADHVGAGTYHISRLHVAHTDFSFSAGHCHTWDQPFRTFSYVWSLDEGKGHHKMSRYGDCILQIFEGSECFGDVLEEVHNVSCVV